MPQQIKKIEFFLLKQNNITKTNEKKKATFAPEEQLNKIIYTQSQNTENDNN